MRPIGSQSTVVDFAAELDHPVHAEPNAADTGFACGAAPAESLYLGRPVSLAASPRFAPS